MEFRCTLSQRKAPLSKSRLNELISWRLLRKNPAGALIWGIFGASLVMDGYFFWHFFNRKEYQVTSNYHILSQLSIIID